MKKMKGVVAAMAYSPYAMYVDQRMRFKHLSLMQDFEDLHMKFEGEALCFQETDAMIKKLQKRAKIDPVGRSWVFEEEAHVLDAKPFIKHQQELWAATEYGG
ncbi:uncharacterized protein LOC120197278 isoform X1 [Hibiscus syriacus]|uniref:uncharacterized protein LOC120197278 isoform X1 n=1 Tax=Hibiscus syriacus TaxID=106335 RepID=UPI001924E3B3|nr:uncharacterized protein LOC120197278 isoform X1 [Hibiscus syriacus]